MPDDFVTKLDLARHELEAEKRAGQIESDLRELKARVLLRDGPIIAELQQFENRVSGLDSQLQQLVKRSTDLLSKADIVEIVRGIVTEESTGERGTRDYLMRVTMFAISIGVLIFATKGGV